MWRLVDNGAARPGVGVDLGLVEEGHVEEGRLIATVLHLPFCPPCNNSAESITANLCPLSTPPPPPNIYASVAAGLMQDIMQIE